MVFQNRLDGFVVARMNRRPKPVIRREQGRALAQTLGVLLQQAQPNVFVYVELARTTANPASCTISSSNRDTPARRTLCWARPRGFHPRAIPA